MSDAVAIALAKLKQATDLITEAQSDLALVEHNRGFDLSQAKWYVKQAVEKLRQQVRVASERGTGT